ncbi:hypothetical protein V2J09_001080 [Rumex salicifolius]
MVNMSTMIVMLLSIDINVGKVLSVVEAATQSAQGATFWTSERSGPSLPAEKTTLMPACIAWNEPIPALEPKKGAKGGDEPNDAEIMCTPSCTASSNAANISASLRLCVSHAQGNHVLIGILDLHPVQILPQNHEGYLDILFELAPNDQRNMLYSKLPCKNIGEKMEVGFGGQKRMLILVVPQESLHELLLLPEEDIMTVRESIFEQTEEKRPSFSKSSVTMRGWGQNMCIIKY